MGSPTFDHIAITVPDLDGEVDRLESSFGWEVQIRMDGFALLTDPSSGIKFELSRSDDAATHVRHLGFTTDDVDVAHQHLLEEGMATSEAPHHRAMAGMYTSYLQAPGGIEIQLVRDD